MNMLQKKITQAKWRREINKKSRGHILDYFFWETTLRCNLSCKHCGSDYRKDEQTPNLSTVKVLSVFHDIAANYHPHDIMVAVTGGEPILRPDLFDVLAEINELHFPWGMVTNAMLMNFHSMMPGRIVIKTCATGIG